MLKESIWLSLGFALVAAVACSSSSSGGAGAKGAAGAGTEAGGAGSGTDSGSVSDYCSQSCEKSHGCDKTIDVQTCSNDCENDFAATGPKLRDDFLGNITDCFTKDDCVNVLGGKALDTCTAEAVAVLAPSKEGTSFCTDYEDAVTKCDGTFDKAECYNKAKTFNDASLKKAEACLTKTCSDIDDCVKATLGVVGSGGVDPNPTGTGGTTGTGPGGDAGAPMMTGNAGAAPVGGGLFTGACTANSPSQCASGTSVNVCVGGKYTVATCKAYLGAAGFAGSTCTGDACDVGDPLDATCAAGTATICQCVTCTTDEQFNYYYGCFTDDPAGTKDVFTCIAQAQSCDEANACIPP